MADDRRATLLLVDDERDSLEPMSLMLEESYNILTAQSGKDALGLLEVNKVEMIIADQRMPGMTGVELLTRVKEMDPTIVRLILTAYADFDAMLNAINEGRVYRYIIKPWGVDDMRLTIQQALEWRELRITKGRLSADLADAHEALKLRTRELREAQQELVKREKLAAVGRFAAEMVHEMNNYLQVILGLSANVNDLKRKESDSLEQIGIQARTLSELAADIRDFALGAAMPFSPRLSDPLSVPRELLRICSHHPGFRDHEIEIQEGDVTPWNLDGRQIKHLLLNLLKNSAKALPGGGKIVIYVGCEENELVYKVIDHGPGVPDKYRKQIWDPFFTTGKDTGSGLGLSICRRVVKMHGGSIMYEDTPGGGATFVVRIPALEI